MKHVNAFLLIYGIILLSAIAFYSFVPNVMTSMAKEEGFIENTSAIIFLISFFTGLYFYFKSTLYRSSLMIIALISLTGFLDEVSFGIWYFGYKAPVIYGQYIDGFHDFFYLGLKVIYDLTLSFPYYMIALMLTGILLAMITMIKFRVILVATIRKVFSLLNTNFRPLFILALFFIFLLFTAMVIDLDRLENNFLFFLEEIFEMGAALALLFCSFSLRSIIQSNSAVVEINLKN